MVLPHLANCGYMFADADELRVAAQTLDGPYVHFLAGMAFELGIVIASGFAERTAESGKSAARTGSAAQ